MKKSLLIVLFFISNYCLSQDWVVLTSGDTIFGKVNIEMPRKDHESFRIKSEKKKLSFKAFNVSVIEHKGERYVPVKLGNRYRIMKEDKTGYLGVYYFRDEDSYEFSRQYLLKLDGRGSIVPNLGFKKQVSRFLNDCESVTASFESDQYKRSDLEIIVDDYNECIENKALENRLEVAEVKDSENPLLPLIDSLKVKLGNRDDDLTALLTDIQSKVVQEQSIPDYLISALSEKKSKFPDLEKDLQQLLDNLGN